MTKYVSEPSVTIITFAPEVRGQAPPLPPRGPAVGIFFGNPLATLISYSSPTIGHSMPLHGAQYRLLEPHILNTRVYETGVVISETSNDGITDVPVGWVPTLAVDPLNSRAVTAFYAAGPRNIAWEDLNEYGGLYHVFTSSNPNQFVRPVTYWARQGGVYVLVGLGTGLPPVSVPPFGA